MKINLKTYWNLHRVSILLTLLSLIFYGVFAYDLNRSDSIKLISLTGALTLFYVKLLQFEKFNFTYLAAVGVLFRLVFWCATPNLSPDYFRFIWDGQLLLHGTNPYLFTPDQLMDEAGSLFPLAERLYSGMTDLSAQHYSNYPPINQYFFALAAALGGSTLIANIIALRAITLLADIGILLVGRQLLLQFNKSPHLIFWYFLNPMIIIELTGNLHFEGVMILFFMIGFLMLNTRRLFLGALFFSLSIGTKLVPLLFLPLLLPRLGLLRSSLFYLSLLACLIVGGFPLFTTDVLPNYLNTLGLWFSNFEFNAGFYNLSQQLAHYLDIPSWRFIRQYGALTPWITAGSALLLSLHPKMRQSRYWFNGALGALTVYYALAAVLHPWYLAFPLLLCLFTRWRFPLWWSVLVLVSYTAYGTSEVQERTIWLLIEYITVFGVLGYELYNLRGYIRVNSKKFGNQTVK